MGPLQGEDPALPDSGLHLDLLATNTRSLASSLCAAELSEDRVGPIRQPQLVRVARARGGCASPDIAHLGPMIPGCGQGRQGPSPGSTLNVGSGIRMPQTRSKHEGTSSPPKPPPQPKPMPRVLQLSRGRTSLSRGRTSLSRGQTSLSRGRTSLRRQRRTTRSARHRRLGTRRARVARLAVAHLKSLRLILLGRIQCPVLI